VNSKVKETEENDDADESERPSRSDNETIQWLQSLFFFSLCWSVGGHLDGTSREKFSDFLKNLSAGKDKANPR
jgi:dynein heavy chain